MIEIRALKPDEWGLLTQTSELEREGFHESGLTPDSLALMARCGILLAFIENNQIIGEAILLRYVQENSALLFSLVTTSTSRRKGRAQQLLNEAFKHLSSHGIEKLFLTVSPENEGAISLYTKKLGFKAIQNLPDHFGPGKHRILMEKIIEKKQESHSQ